jgi:UDP-N-acetylmuramoyl-tripeptide--D-alanyl-D-alanine ligase
MKNVFKKIIVSILTWEAMMLLRNQSPKVIAVTGSVGKTSAKDAIFSIISGKFNVRKNEKSFNSEIGVPLTVLGLKNAWGNPLKWLWNIKLGFWKIFFSRNYPRILILEIGADKPDDIKNIVSWIKPDIAVVTALASIPVHVENFGSPEKVYEEKGRLVEALAPQGIAVLNADDEKTLQMRKKTQGRKILFGLARRSLANGAKSSTDVLGSYPVYTYNEQGRPKGISFRIDYDGKSIPFEVNGSAGYAQTYSALAAAAVAIALGMSVLEIAEAAKKIGAPKGRMKILEGIKNTIIIDDTYNSSPAAAEAALKALKEINPPAGGKGSKIAALADMLELGRYSESEHKRIGKVAAGSADILVTVGTKSHWIADGALKKGMPKEKIYQFEKSGEAGSFVRNILKDSDIILAKGSQGMRMEKFVEEILLHPENKKELLVRQDKEWQRK